MGYEVIDSPSHAIDIYFHMGNIVQEIWIYYSVDYILPYGNRYELLSDEYSSQMFMNDSSNLNYPIKSSTQ